MAETLREYLMTADVIEDDAEFCEVEHDMAYEYCRRHNFHLSEEDMETILARGLEDSFQYWREEQLWESLEESDKVKIEEMMKRICIREKV